MRFQVPGWQCLIDLTLLVSMCSLPEKQLCDQARRAVVHLAVCACPESFFACSSRSAGIRGFSFLETDLKSGSKNGGVHKTQFWFEETDEGGTWSLLELWLSDVQGNHRRYQSQDIFLFGQKGDVNSTIEVNSKRISVSPCFRFLL